MVTVYGIKNCDSVKKALAFFKKHNIDYQLIDFKEQGVTLSKIQEWLQHTDIKTLFNSRSTTYRTLKLKELNLDEQQKMEYLAKEPLLIKRPVVEFDGKVLVGFNEVIYTRSFL